VVVCLEQGANDLPLVQLMPLPPHHLLLHYNTEWFTFLVLAAEAAAAAVVVVVVVNYLFCSIQHLRVFSISSVMA